MVPPFTPEGTPVLLCAEPLSVVTLPHEDPAMSIKQSSRLSNLAHVLTFAAHRRTLVLLALNVHGHGELGWATRVTGSWRPRCDPSRARCGCARA
ncbi:hypothetical protein GCM10007269_10140 [Microbacterium murale]|uniref:Uncharacterized protein n=1 Tax=Microbacterium murale TaxID=1081040 RepID=A0ABQ1RGF8_9MICO|nr:hypothetical protein GCM10007269_10140 [Microbacterium murale]